MDTETLLTKLEALADPSRLAILTRMTEGFPDTCCDRLDASEDGCCVADVVKSTGLSQPTVSHHLAQLASAGLVRRARRGNWVCYFPDRDAVADVALALQAQLSGRRVENEPGMPTAAQAICFVDDAAGQEPPRRSGCCGDGCCC